MATGVREFVSVEVGGDKRTDLLDIDLRYSSLKEYII